MDIAKARTWSNRGMFRKLMLAVGVAAVASAIAVPAARADDGDWHHRHHEWREHEWHEHGWREYRPYAYGYPGYGYYDYPGYGYAYAPPPVIYAPPPPPVVYAPPPPVVYAPPVYAAPSSIDFVFPIRIH
jgi:hypothetical protein